MVTLANSLAHVPLDRRSEGKQQAILGVRMSSPAPRVRDDDKRREAAQLRVALLVGIGQVSVPDRKFCEGALDEHGAGKRICWLLLPAK